MRLGVMQPYFFPYLGYFQLIAAVDRFVFLDDVNFIKQGWINRNRILINGQPSYITVPLRHASPNRNINEIEVDPDERWRKKLLKSVEQSYRKAPNYDEGFSLFHSVMTSSCSNIAELAKTSVRAICDAIGMNVEWVSSSTKYENRSLKGQERIIDICRQEHANVYVNASGGRGLYTSADFSGYQIQLQFCDPVLSEYPQPGVAFVPGLSILDVLMHNSTAVTKKLASHFDCGVA
jgi:hypothetical protein